MYIFLTQGGLMPYYIYFTIPIPYKYDILMALSSWDFFNDVLQVCSLLMFIFLHMTFEGILGVGNVHDYDHHELADPQLTGIAMSMFAHAWS